MVVRRLTTLKVYGEDMLTQFFPQLPEYLQLIEARPHVQRTMADRDAALAAFVALNVKYDG